MIKKRKVPRRPQAGVRELRTRLQAAEETLRALRAGEVDAIVVARAKGEHVITLAGAELAYRILFDQMNEGAVTLTRDGVIAYCNRRFAEIVRMPLARVIGAPLRRFVPPAEQPAFDALVAAGHRANRRGDTAFRADGGAPVPVSVSFAPLQLEGSADVIGVIGVVTDISERERAEELRNRLIQQAVTAQEEERRRIARELHDEAGQSLTALLVGLRTIEESRTIAEAAELAQRLRGIAAQTLDEVGRLSRGLHPSILDEVGLPTAVTRHAQEFAHLHGVAVDVRIEGLESEILPPLVQTTVYRVLQEALTNVAKHAGARSVSVRLVRGKAAVELRVQDDGAGFDPAAGAEAEAGDRGDRHLGLQVMRERAALLGGSLEVESQAGGGTTITAHFPTRRA
ncbi:MAG TPA: ATP-binding protein [Gemmatimonadales bacterium]|nr:ATP-binding protein [Gemmatimonadales bacterium]